MKQYSWFLLIVLVFFGSCGNYKRFTYLQTTKPENADTLYRQNLIQYKLQPADVLYVKILSLDKSITELFNLDASASYSPYISSLGGSMYLMGYSIDNVGYIILPILGKVHVAGLTIEEAKQIIQKLAESYITDARAEVKLVSFKISMLGEVIRPGQYTIFNDRANIFEAISLAGDISYNGNRRNVLIVRTLINGTKTIKVDLTKRELLSSQQYYLQPNDIVYIEPYRTTAFRLRVADYSVFLTLITSTITAVLLINQFRK
jgi:polysaccharide export outer membrane protein